MLIKSLSAIGEAGANSLKTTADNATYGTIAWANAPRE